MIRSKLFIPTLKEKPKEVESISHSLSLRAGLIKPLMSGVNCYLPLGWRVLLKIINIVREEMNKIGAQELVMPSLSPKELWEKTGRWSSWGKELFRLKDRKNTELCLAPTHEEIITYLASGIKSYKELPQIWYQIQTKFRDEPRPRGGVLRAREFIMKDSYSFDIDEENGKKSYYAHREAYCKILTRCGLDFSIVPAASGIMGGALSEEFMVDSVFGEDAIIYCPNCNYKSSLSIAKIGITNEVSIDEELKKVYTPVPGDVKSISNFLSVPPSRLMKSLLYFFDNEPVFILLRGDHEVSEDKIAMLGRARLATNDEVKSIVGVDAGYVSPIGLNIKTYADNSLKGKYGLVTGANEEFYHYTGVNVKRDLNIDRWVDVELANESDPCYYCGKPIEIKNTIEVGHIFNLGTKYSESIGAFFLDKNGKRKPLFMGCYGIGIERIMAACIETHNDDKGIIWPKSIAPYQVIILPLNMRNEKVKSISEEIYEKLLPHYEVLIDDRDESAGYKFNDAMLIGIPIQIIISEKVVEKDEVEIKSRDGKIFHKVNKNFVIEEVLKYVHQ